MRKFALVLLVLAGVVLVPTIASAQATLAGFGSGYVRRRAAGRDRRGRQSCLDREGQDDGD